MVALRGERKDFTANDLKCIFLQEVSGGVSLSFQAFPPFYVICRFSRNHLEPFNILFFFGNLGFIHLPARLWQQFSNVPFWGLFGKIILTTYFVKKIRFHFRKTCQDILAGCWYCCRLLFRNSKDRIFIET